MNQKKNEESRRPFTVRLAPETYRDFRKYIAEKDLKLQDGCEIAVKYLLAETKKDRAGVANPFAGVTDRERETLLTLLELMRAGDSDARHLVLSTLRYVAAGAGDRMVRKPLRKSA